MHSRRRRCGKALVFSLAVCLLLTACGGGGAAQPAASSPTKATAAAAPSGLKLLSYRGADRTKVLVAAAKQEKSVTWYTTMAGPILQAIQAAFQAKYPYLKLQIYRTDTAALMTRELDEAKAHQAGADVFGGDYADTLAAKSAGILVPYYSPSAAAETGQLRATTSNGLTVWSTVVQYYFSFAYNTRLFKGTVPTTIQDLAAPDLKGKMAIAGSSTGSWWVGDILTNAGQSLLTKLEHQNISVQEMSAKALLDLVAKGEFAASPTIFRSHALYAAAQGEPVKWVALKGGMTAIGEYAAIPTNVTHPAAAMLFLDFLLSPAMSQVFHKYDYLRPTESVGASSWYVGTPNSNLTSVEKNLKLWSGIVRGKF